MEMDDGSRTGIVNAGKVRYQYTKYGIADSSIDALAM